MKKYSSFAVLYIASILVLIMIICKLFSVSFFYENDEKDNIYNKNVISFKENINNLINNSGNSIITFPELTDFKWDEVYIFAPYTDEKYCKRVLNIEDNINLGSNGGEDETKIVFIYNGEVVCYINDITKNLKFNISYNYNRYGDYEQINYFDNDYMIELTTNDIVKEHKYLYIKKYNFMSNCKNEILDYMGEWKNISKNQVIKISEESISLNGIILDNPYINIEYTNYLWFKDKYNINLDNFGLSLNFEKAALELNVLSNSAINNIYRLIIVDKDKMLLEQNNEYILMEKVN